MSIYSWSTLRKRRRTSPRPFPIQIPVHKLLLDECVGHSQISYITVQFTRQWHVFRYHTFLLVLQYPWSSIQPASLIATSMAATHITLTAILLYIPYCSNWVIQVAGQFMGRIPKQSEESQSNLRLSQSNLRCPSGKSRGACVECKRHAPATDTLSMNKYCH